MVGVRRTRITYCTAVEARHEAETARDWKPRQETFCTPFSRVVAHGAYAFFFPSFFFLSQVICATLSGCGSGPLVDAVTWSGKGFDTVIVDEACQVSSCLSRTTAYSECCTYIGVPTSGRCTHIYLQVIYLRTAVIPGSDTFSGVGLGLYGGGGADGLL